MFIEYIHNRKYVNYNLNIIVDRYIIRKIDYIN